MAIETLFCKAEKLLVSPAGQETLKRVAVAAAPVVVTAAPFVAAAAVGGAIGTGIGVGASWVIDKLTSN